MFVYRIQNKYGVGPYSMFIDYKIEPWATREHKKENGQPEPIKDKFNEAELYEILTDPKIRFGFKTLDQLTAWFNKDELENLKKMGFSIYKVAAQTVFYGKSQVAFIRKGDKKDDIKIS